MARPSGRGLTSPPSSRWTAGGRTGEYQRVPEITPEHESSGERHVSSDAKTPNHQRQLIRNQQVLGSSPSAGSRFPNRFRVLLATSSSESLVGSNWAAAKPHGRCTPRWIPLRASSLVMQADTLQAAAPWIARRSTWRTSSAAMATPIVNGLVGRSRPPSGASCLDRDVPHCCARRPCRTARPDWCSLERCSTRYLAPRFAGSRCPAFLPSCFVHRIHHARREPPVLAAWWASRLSV